MGPQPTQRAWGLAPTFRAQHVASEYPSPRRPGAHALSCRAVSHWQGSSRASRAHSRCTGSHARSACDLHQWGHSQPSGPGGWRPPPELSTVASECLAPRCPGARAPSCRRSGASANGLGWSALRVGFADSRTKHASCRDKCSVGGRLVLHRTKRARAARHGTRKRRLRRSEAAAADKARCLRRGASANGVGWSAPRVGRADNRAKHTQRAVTSAPWAVGWFFTRRSARGPRATGRKRDGYDGSKPQPPTERGVGGEEPRPTAWDRARCELAAQTTAPSTCSAQ